jgi:hypothetical protein
MNKPEMTISAYPEPYARADLQELAEYFSGMCSVEIDEIREEGALWGLTLSFAAAAVLGEWVIKPFVDGFIKKLGEGLADFVSKRFRRKQPQAPDIDVPFIPIELRNIAPQGYSSDRLKGDSFRIFVKFDVEVENSDKLAGLQGRLMKELQGIEESSQLLWRLIASGQVPEALTEVALHRDPVSGKWRYVNLWSYPDPPRPIPDFGIIYTGDLYGSGTPAWERVDRSRYFEKFSVK